MNRRWAGLRWSGGIHILLILLLLAMVGSMQYLLQAEWRDKRDQRWAIRVSQTVSRRLESAIQERTDLVNRLADSGIGVEPENRMLQMVSVIMPDLLRVKIWDAETRRTTLIWARNTREHGNIEQESNDLRARPPVGTRIVSNGLLRITGGLLEHKSDQILIAEFSALRLLAKMAPTLEGRFTTQWRSAEDGTALTVGDEKCFDFDLNSDWQRVFLRGQNTRLAVLPSGTEKKAWRLLHTMNLLVLLAFAVALFLIYSDAMRLRLVERQVHKTNLQRLVGLSMDRIEEEKRRQSSFLHDEIGHGLTMVKLMLETQGVEFSHAPEGALIIERLNQLIAEIRSAAARLRPQLIRDIGWQKTVAHLAHEVGDTAGLDVQLHLDDQALPLDYLAQEQLYQVVREAFTNVIKHASATLVRLSMHIKCQTVTLTISDNGCGFQDKHQSGWGMLGMREKIERMGGDWNVQSKQGRGTTIRVCVKKKEPLHEQTDNSCADG